MLGITEIDSQHKVLVDLINKLDDAIKQGKGATGASEVVAELKRYAVKHFLAEERMMAVHGYKDADVHKKVHGAFTGRVEQFERDLAAGKLGVATVMSNYLSEWLSAHIMVEDRKYVPTMVSAGVR